MSKYLMELELNFTRPCSLSVLRRNSHDVDPWRARPLPGMSLDYIWAVFGWDRPIGYSVGKQLTNTP